MKKFLVRNDSVYLEEVETAESDDFKGKTFFVSEENKELEILNFLDYLFDTQDEACQFIVSRERSKLKALEKRLHEFIPNTEKGKI